MVPFKLCVSFVFFLFFFLFTHRFWLFFFSHDIRRKEASYSLVAFCVWSDFIDLLFPSYLSFLYRQQGGGGGRQRAAPKGLDPNAHLSIFAYESLHVPAAVQKLNPG